jgi:hypothetical protein
MSRVERETEEIRKEGRKEGRNSISELYLRTASEGLKLFQIFILPYGVNGVAGGLSEDIGFEDHTYLITDPYATVYPSSRIQLSFCATFNPSLSCILHTGHGL